MIRGIHITLLLGSVVFLAAAPALGQTQPDQRRAGEAEGAEGAEGERVDEDKLFEQVFGKPRTGSDSIQRITVPFFINEQRQGQLQVLLLPGGVPAVRLQAAPLLEKTLEIIRPDVQDKLRAAVDPEGNLTLEALQQNGLEAIFDEGRLQLQIQIPPAQRKTNVHNLQGGGLPPEARDALPPSKVSGYINLRGGQNFVWSGQQNVKLGRQPLRLDLEGAFNLNGWVMEGNIGFTEASQPQWVRGDMRIVRDAPTQAIRYVIGDLAIPVTGYQSSKPMAGITVAKNFSLQPYQVTRPISQYKFFLERPSRVEVLINNRLVQTLQLPPGTQDIRDLPLSTGINNVQLVITDDVGRVQRLDFSNPVAGGLLAPGLQQFAYSLGLPSRVEEGSRTYDWSQPTLTLSHRWGLSDTLTMGGYLQGNPKQQLAGIEGIWATSFGNLGWDLALSHASDIGSDYALRLRYDYLKIGENNPSQRSFRMALEHRGSRFMTVGELLPRNDYSFDLSADYSQLLFWGMGGNLSASYQFGRSGVPDTYKLSFGLSKSLNNKLAVNLKLSQSHSSTGQDESRALLSLSLRPLERQSVQTTTDIGNTSSPTNRLTWNYSSPKSIGGINASVGVAGSPNDYDLTGKLTYTGYRANVDLSHDFIIARDGRESTSNITTLNWGTALVFVDGHFGWSRPINNSFALVIRKENLRNQQIGINPGGGSYTARADNLGSAVVPDLQHYQVSKLQIDAPDLPLGYDLGSNVYHLLPSYKSGTLVRVGTDATVFLRGVLLNAKGEPVSMQAGEIISLTDPKWQPVTVFTNKAGKFAVEGFKPGNYELRVFTHQHNPIRFEIPSDKTGVYDIGKLQIPT